MRRRIAGTVALTVAAGLLGGATAAAEPRAVPAVTVRAQQVLGTVGPNALGANTPIWNGHLVDPEVAGLIRQAGIGTLVFNGGGVSDLYHWRDGSMSPDPQKDQHPIDYSTIPPKMSFDEFERVARETGARTLVHANYGTGTPQEAADWVRYANRERHDGVRDWAIGEEVYLNGGIPGLPYVVEPDAHEDRSPAAYGRNVVSYARAMKAVDPSIRIGVELAPPLAGSPFLDWDREMLRNAAGAVDFVDLHWYPYDAGRDFYAPVRDIPAVMDATRALLDETVGRRVDVVVGETNSAVWPAATQTAVDNAVYLADDELSLLEHGATAVDWWALHNGSAINDQDLGLLSSGTTLNRGPGEQPTDVPFAPYFGQRLTTDLARPGSRLVGVRSGAAAVVGHAARQPDGSLVVLLLNEDAGAAHDVDLRVAGYQVRQGTWSRYFGPGSTDVQASWKPGSAEGVRTLPANSLTELVLWPER
jgi:alpha-N-arabinofuranosidase